MTRQVEIFHFLSKLCNQLYCNYALAKCGEMVAITCIPIKHLVQLPGEKAPAGFGRSLNKKFDQINCQPLFSQSIDTITVCKL
jgi:hypothetical protein